MRRRTEDDLSLHSALRGLPKREPPPALWSRIATTLAEHDAAAAVEERDVGPRNAAPIRYALAAGFAALVFLAAVLLVGRSDSLDDSQPAPRVVDAPGEAPATDGTSEIADLLAESARLERTLVAFPRHEGVIRVGTAGTIAGLEDQIAWIDAELSASAAFDVDPSYQEILWRERVVVMNALVDVHYAQLPARVLLP